MNTLTHDEMIELIQAHKDGKIIEYRCKYHGWTSASPTKWNFVNFEYRVKPQPEEPKWRPWEYKDRRTFMGVSIQHKIEPRTFAITGCKDYCVIAGCMEISFQQLFGQYETINGMICGERIV